MIKWMSALGLLCLLTAGAAAAADWRMDPAASRLAFEASYQGEAVPGTFKQFDTRLHFDPAKPADSRLEVTVKLPSADFGSAEINEAVREPEWFDFARFMEASFVSTDIQRAAPDRYIARGMLRLKGASHTVAVPFTWKASGNSAEMKGELTLKRTAFGIGTGEWATDDPIGTDVKVIFDVRLQSS